MIAQSHEETKAQSPYFADPLAVKRLNLALAARRGTPFRAGMGKPGAGYDCGHLVLDVYAASGLPVEGLKKFPAVSLNHGKFNSSSPLLDYLHEDATCRRQIKRHEPDEPIMAGDMLAIRRGLGSNHFAIATSPAIAWHVPRGGSVSHIAIINLKPYLHAIYRIYK